MQVVCRRESNGDSRESLWLPQSQQVYSWSHTCNDLGDNSICNHKHTIFLLIQIIELFLSWSETKRKNWNSYLDKNETKYWVDTGRPTVWRPCTLYTTEKFFRQNWILSCVLNSWAWHPNWVLARHNTDDERIYCTSPCLDLRVRVPTPPVETHWTCWNGSTRLQCLI